MLPFLSNDWPDKFSGDEVAAKNTSKPILYLFFIRHLCFKLPSSFNVNLLKVRLTFLSGFVTQVWVVQIKIISHINTHIMPWNCCSPIKGFIIEFIFLCYFFYWCRRVIEVAFFVEFVYFVVRLLPVNIFFWSFEGIGNVNFEIGF